MKRNLPFRATVALLAALTLSLSTLQCFGGFPLVRRVYGFNKSVADSGTLGGRLIQTLVMILITIIPVYGVATLLDLVVFNLIEFWTGKPILASNMSSPDGRVTFRQISAGEMQINIKSDNGPVSLFVFADKPGEFFTKTGNRYLPVTLPEELKGFDANGKTFISCSNDSSGIRCSEGKQPNAWMQRDIRKTDLERSERLVRAHFESPTIAAR